MYHEYLDSEGVSPTKSVDSEDVSQTLSTECQEFGTLQEFAYNPLPGIRRFRRLVGDVGERATGLKRCVTNALQRAFQLRIAASKNDHPNSERVTICWPPNVSLVPLCSYLHSSLKSKPWNLWSTLFRAQISLLPFVQMDRLSLYRCDYKPFFGIAVVLWRFLVSWA